MTLLGPLADLSYDRVQRVADYHGSVVQVAHFQDVPGVPRVSMDERASGRLAGGWRLTRPVLRSVCESGGNFQS